MVSYRQRWCLGQGFWREDISETQNCYRSWSGDHERFHGEGRASYNPQLCPEGRKTQRCSSFPRGPRVQLLILHEPNSFPGKSTLILHTVPLFFSSLLLSPLFPQLQVCEAKKRRGTGSSMLPIQPGSFQSSLLLYPSSEGHQDILFAQDLYIFSPEP